MMRLLLLSMAAPLLLLTSFVAAVSPASSQPSDTQKHTVVLGDTWTALQLCYNLETTQLRAAAGIINTQRQPPIGSEITLPMASPQNGRLLRPFRGGALELGARNGRNPWAIALTNNLAHPYNPMLYAPIFLPGGSRPPRELPPGVDGLALSPPPYHPGSALALRARVKDGDDIRAKLDGYSLVAIRQDNITTILGATGAFYPPGQSLLTLRIAGKPLWEQPLTISDRPWDWEQITFYNTAVLDPETIRLERERLQVIWDETTPLARWRGRFAPPITDYLEVSSPYGARRSINGGPYSTYHEGADYSAYRGSEVFAPAAGKVALAEELAIRGNAIILDHGLGLHSGYYHLSAIHVLPNQVVRAGDLIGEVGSTGRSTGNHLHWDLLVGRTWIDPLAWLEQDIAPWLSPSTTVLPLQIR